MEHAKKFILMSVDNVSRFGTTPNILQDHSQNLQTKMSDILDRTDIPADRRWAQYGQQQYQYNTHRDALNQPIKISIHDRDDEQDEFIAKSKHKPREILSSTVDYFQKVYREKAAGLVRFLME